MSTRPPRLPGAARAGLLVLPIALLAGCVQQTATGPDTMYSYDLWIPAVLLLGGAAAIPAGWALRGRTARLGWSVLFGGVLAVYFAPTMYLDRVVVGQEHFVVRTGMLGTATAYDLKYADIRGLKITSEVSTGRRGRKQTTYFFVCDMKTGEPVKIPMGGKLVEAALPSLLVRLMAHQVPIADETEPTPG